jgi:hypothetical protein
MKLKLTGSGGTGRGYELLLDGVKQEHASGVVLNVNVYEPNTATVTYLIDGAEVEVELPDPPPPIIPPETGSDVQRYDGSGHE